MMADSKVVEAFGACRGLLPETLLPVRGGLRDEHLAFMCEEGVRLVEAGRREKAMRWLGFVQGALWASGRAPIDTLKRMNMPRDP